MEGFLILYFQIGDAVIQTVRNLVAILSLGANCQERDWEWGITVGSLDPLGGRRMI